MGSSENKSLKVEAQSWRVDSSYHMRTNVSVGRGIIRGISVHNIHKGEVSLFSSMYIWKG